VRARRRMWLRYASVTGFERADLDAPVIGRQGQGDALVILGSEAECYRLALAEELGMRPLAAHCHLGPGTLYQRLGRDEAQVELATAAELYRAMEMMFWLEKAEAAMAQAGAA
jgi:hypothetical protein